LTSSLLFSPDIEKKLYKEAKIKLFYNDLHPEFFYVIEGGKNGN
jgi:rod shape-determining protein MreC